MLILTRRVGETLNIGDEVQVTVLGIKGNQVRLGVNAPKEIPVHREEIYERIKKEKEAGLPPRKEYLLKNCRRPSSRWYGAADRLPFPF